MVWVGVPASLYSAIPMRLVSYVQDSAGTAPGDSSAAAAAADAVEEAAYHIQQADVEGAFTLLSGIATINTYSLLLQVITLGVLLTVVFVIAVRRV